MKKIVISIPAYNEEKTLPAVLTEIKQIMKKTDYKYAIHILDDGSMDNTLEVAKKFTNNITIHKVNMGLAKTFPDEMEACLKLNADIIVHTDADGQYPAEYIPILIQKVIEGNDLVLGSRFKKSKGRSLPFLKRIGNQIFAKVISGLVKKRISDSTTGFRAFTSKVAKEIKFINTFTYTQEQIIRAAKKGFKITEIPIKARIIKRPSRLFNNSFEYAIKSWINILRIYRDYNPLRFFGVLGLVIISISFLLGIYLTIFLFLTMEVGAIDKKIPTVLLAVMLFLFGTQIILFGFLADARR